MTQMATKEVIERLAPVNDIADEKREAAGAESTLAVPFGVLLARRALSALLPPHKEPKKKKNKKKPLAKHRRAV
jgi:hypothetical protein